MKLNLTMISLKYILQLYHYAQNEVIKMMMR